MLLVDDYPDAVEVWAAFLEAAGFATDTATTAHAALERVRANPPNAIVTDLILPDSSGIEVARLLQREPATAGIALVAVTGAVDRATIDMARSLFRVVLAKPCDPDELVRHLIQVLAVVPE